MCHMQERQLFIMYLSSLTSEVYLLVNLFEKPVQAFFLLFVCLFFGVFLK